MTLKATLSRLWTTALTNPARREGRRKVAQRKRLSSGTRATIHYFHQADDPYSHLAAQCLVPLAARYDVEIVCHLVPPPDDTAAPERDKLSLYALRDAPRLARRYGLSFPERASLPNADQIAYANGMLVEAVTRQSIAIDAPHIGEALWHGDAGPKPSQSVQRSVENALKEGGELRSELGHYLSAMFYFEGEWYWGVDRLHHLETRLRNQQFMRRPDAKPFAPYQEMVLDGRAAEKPVTIDFWFSFRSPYSYIAAARVHRLAVHYGAELRLRFILPMVMRGLPVPGIKRRYIIFDVKREAEILGLPFGTMVDPVGKGVERALAVLHRASAIGRGPQFAESGLRAAFADGIDLASDRGLTIWDSVVLAASAEAECRLLLSEDLQEGFTWRGVTVANPFAPVLNPILAAMLAAPEA